jgi:UDPglucose 6-dehydrogenase
MERAKEEMPEVVYCKDPYETVKGADAMIVCTEWEEFRILDFERIKNLMRRRFILDGRNIYDKEKMLGLGFEYIGIGT